MAKSAIEYPIEIEGKYRVDDPIELLAKLDRLQAQELQCESHEDHYLRHPARDFKITDEALRMRRVNDRSSCHLPKEPTRAGCAFGRV